ncbi:MAG: ATP-binding protein [Desulfobacula sp.]|jgi:signal transduction histidine kinase
MKKKISIQTKLLISGLTIFIAYISLCYFSFQTASHKMVESFGRNLETLSDVMLEQIQETIAAQVELLSFFSMDQTLHERLNAADSRSSYDQTLSERLEKQFIQYFETRFGLKHFSRVMILSDQGKTIAAAPAGNTPDLRNQNFWKKALKEDFSLAQVGGPEISDDTGISICIRINDASGKPLGLLVAFLPFEWIIREAETDIRRQFGLDILLTDAEGHLLFSTKPFRPYEDISDKPFFVQSRNMEGFFRIHEKTGSRIHVQSSFSQLKGFDTLNWLLFVSASENSVMKPLALLRFQFMTVYLVIGFLLLATLFYISRSITQPILGLHQAVENLKAGRPMEPMEPGANDEIGELVLAFHAMAGEIKASHEALKMENEQRKKAEQKILNANRDLAQSNRDLDDFSYIVSHDLREPLRGISSFSSFLMEDYENILDEDGKQKLETLIRLSNRMESQIESILYYSRVGRMELSIAETDLNAVIAEVMAHLHHLITDRHACIDIPEPLPKIRCDRVRVFDLFLNLISNAVKYNDNPEKHVEIGLKKEGPIFYVKDNGIGIEEKHRKSIFKIFKRLHGKDKYGGGVGAGLTIVQKIVERHNGRIWVESSMGKGSVFYFTLQSKEGL